VTLLPLGVDRSDPNGSTLAELTLGQAMAAGLLQCLAVLPGVSRSGATISAGVFAGLTREAATRFSFLLVIPALVGATLLSLGDLGEGGETTLELGVGIVAAFVSGYLAIRYLVALVSRERLTGFAYYCIAASIIGLTGYAIIGPTTG
jgi:undecaprenyl-diphosphatase